MLLIDKLRIKDGLTDTEKRIADYILQHLAEIPSLNVETIAKHTYTSHSSVIRLAKKMGYDGFKNFRFGIAEMAHSQMFHPAFVDANFPFASTDPTEDILKKMADLTISTIHKTRAQMNNAIMEQAAETIEKAQRVFLFALGDSQIRARSFQNKLVKINKYLIVADEYGDDAWNAANLCPNDCAIFITYRGKNAQYQKILKHLTSIGVPSIVITGNPKAKISKLANLAIVASHDELDFLKVGTFSSQVAFEYILDALFALMYAKEYQKNIVELRRKQQLLEQGILSEYPREE
ncbi:hypothetical protein A5886_001479 [Enterococcus sp. 8G7_MSG3316]|uniref:RpiR family transcriptional regulator n=1 Tax=Candidatus Enterococcus testudinis TaxID=1834191 RepID=A0A242A623_9ENTE|nr:MurR/RpiR family transcriptional regulator [Enterococcus sp. 8G7_MSG3316]OTN76402.1 hypothetical protein A5886_001479 [Enterococcus sp. 8G7_MSG3316]